MAGLRFALLYLSRGPGADALGRTGSLPGFAQQGLLFPEGGKVVVQVELTACRFQRRRNQLNPRSLKEVGQSPRTSRPNQSTARPVASGRVTVRTKHYFLSTAQPQVSHWSGTGLKLWFVSGSRVGGGGRPVTTVKDGSLGTQAVNPRKGWKLSRDRIPKESETDTPESETRFEPEVRRSPKESVTPESATRDQPRSQSLLPNEPEAQVEQPT